MTKYRHEYKIHLNLSDYYAVRARLRAVLKHDSNVDENGEYHIRSLYFDNYRNKALREKEDGVDNREKFRLRCYNHDFSFIKLEKKSKLKGLTSKISAPITENEVDCLLKGETEWMVKNENALVVEFYSKMKAQLLRPKVMVDYLREPFVFAPGNVRVTIDRQIQTSVDNINMLDPTIAMAPVAENPIILEIKYDEFIPDLISSVVGIDNRGIGEFSKYGVSRLYSTN